MRSFWVGREERVQEETLSLSHYMSDLGAFSDCSWFLIIVVEVRPCIRSRFESYTHRAILATASVARILLVYNF